MKDITFRDLLDDYCVWCKDIQNSLAGDIIIQSAALAKLSENSFWNGKCHARGKVKNYFTTNLMRLIE